MITTILALTTNTCINCKPIKKYLHEKVEGYNIVIMDEEHPDFMKNCTHWNATKAPTVLLIEDGEEVWRTGDLEELIELLDSSATK